MFLFNESGEPEQQTYDRYVEWEKEQEIVEEVEEKNSLFNFFKAQAEKFSRRLFGRGKKNDKNNSKQSLPNNTNELRIKDEPDLPTPEKYKKMGSPKIIIPKGYNVKAFLKQAVDLGYKKLLNTSEPGSGKSHSRGQLYPEELGLNRSFYLSSDHRNPTVATVEEMTDLVVRINGMFRDDQKLTPLGNPHIRWAQPGEERNTIGNCPRTLIFHRLIELGYTEADEEAELNPVCATCSLRGPCRGRDDEGERIDPVPGATFRRDRRDTLEGDSRIRAQRVGHYPPPCFFR